MTWSIENDFADILERSRDDLEKLRGTRVLVTGGTGFVGTWLVSALHFADQFLDLGIRVELLTRDPATFADRQPELASWVTVIRGDVTRIPEFGTVDAAIHAATPASAAFNDSQPDLMRTTIVDGMRSMLKSLEESGSIPVLFTSSGAVYGAQPAAMQRITESYWPADDAIEPRNAYALGKRDAEQLARNAEVTGGPSVRIARLFAFVGPYLPLDAHFAIGNFIRDAMSGGPIRVSGDGTAIRSYMYASDMVVALLAVLVRGTEDHPYNVGASDPTSIAQLATTVRDVIAPEAEVQIAGRRADDLPTGAGSRYLPDTSRLADELKVRATVPLEDAIRRTARWSER